MLYSDSQIAQSMIDIKKMLKTEIAHLEKDFRGHLNDKATHQDLMMEFTRRLENRLPQWFIMSHRLEVTTDEDDDSAVMVAVLIRDEISWSGRLWTTR